INTDSSPDKFLELSRAFHEFKNKIQAIISTGGMNQEKIDLGKIAQKIEGIYNTIVTSYVSAVLKELEPKINEINGDLQKCINGQPWYQGFDIQKDSPKPFQERITYLISLSNENITGNDEFDKILVDAIKNKCIGFFEEQKDSYLNNIQNKFGIYKIQEILGLFEILYNSQLISTEYYDEIKTLIFSLQIEKLFPKLKTKIEAILKELDEHIKNNNVKAINIPTYKELLQDEIREIMSQITSGSEEEKQLKQITDEFEQILRQKIIAFTFQYLETKISFDIENFTSKLEFDEYEKTSDFSHWRISGILDETNPNNAYSIYESMKKETLIKNMGKSNFIKKKGDLVYFGNVAFPIYKRQTKKQQWKLDPKIDGDNVIVQYREIVTGLKIKPSDEKRLRFDDRKYEFTREEYKKLLQEYEEVKKNDGDVKKQIPHILKVLQRLNIMTHSAYGDIPELSSKIKITPYILENLQSFITLARDQILRQDGIGILEGEAGVGKNVLVDIFAHYTHRPVFVFPCNKRASKEDLTYQWLIDENGTYKLNSKVYEAIKTPGSILVFDEINTLPTEVIKLLNGLFDYRRTLTMPYDNEHQKAQDDVLIFGTQNPEHYDGTQKLPQDASSRANKVYIDYPKMEGENNEVHFDEALITYANMPYYFKLLDYKGYSQEKIAQMNLLKLRKNSKQTLTPEEEKELKNFENSSIQDEEFIENWNKIYNFGKKSEVEENYGSEYIEGMRDLHKLIYLAHYIRKRYREKKEGLNKLDPIDVSISQRDLNKMMGLLCEGLSPKQAFIRIYTSSISDMGNRVKMKTDLENLTI
ncbi:MAG: AAA family ATPase, partial [Candidatus Gracilibacteria bacterium]|nr:AAA family ATPase [Candidatus Gracilibacteria bacterium]